jgi:Ca2+-binding EF-hand superfamily protein
MTTDASKSDDVASALHRMVEALGDRNGLSRIEEVFKAIDTDKNGQISIEEFTAGEY